MSDIGKIPGGAGRAPGEEVPRPGGVDPTPEVAFEQGIEIGREWMQQAAVKLAAWSEDNPGQMLLAGLGLGFIIGKLFFSPSRRTIDFDD